MGNRQNGKFVTWLDHIAKVSLGTLSSTKLLCHRNGASTDESYGLIFQTDSFIQIVKSHLLIPLWNDIILHPRI